MALQTGLEVLKDTQALVDKVVPRPRIRDLALELAVHASYLFYDALFMATAIQEQGQVVTFDRKLAIKFPDHVKLLE